jgi:uncharacterized DUF497 family protein
MSLEFEWSKAKAKSNYAKHGVSFDFAKLVFEDPFALELLDNRRNYGEDRFVVLGLVEGQLLFVAFTERNEVIRLISARRATKYEQEIYLESQA